MNKQGTLLIVDDNRNILTTVRLLTEPVFEHIATIANPAGIPGHLRELRPDVVLLDMNFGKATDEEAFAPFGTEERAPRFSTNNGNEGLYWLRQIRQMAPQTRVVLFTAYADIDLAVRGIKEGATDFVVKPFENERMLEALTAARDKGKSRQALHKGEEKSGMFWGSSSAMSTLRRMVEKVAATDANILITGENGTGKEVLAKEIHRLSARAGAQMLPVKGAFTDAKADRPGKFELASGGTLFLDEIGNLSYSLQAKLLTALQRRHIVRVGGSTEIPVDVRLICATNRDLQQMVGEGTFREDLLYRINTIHLHLPPLRQRAQDIVPLADMFIRRYAGGCTEVIHTALVWQHTRTAACHGESRHHERSGLHRPRRHRCRPHAPRETHGGSADAGRDGAAHDREDHQGMRGQPLCGGRQTGHITADII